MNKTIRFGALLSLSLTFYGCGSMPQTAKEFKAAVPGSTFGKKDSLIVNRGYKDVVDSFKTMSKKCLDKTVVTKVARAGGSLFNTPVESMRKSFTPTLLISKTKTELHFQQKVDGGAMMMNMSKTPKKGMYMLVTDILKKPNNKTSVNIYYSTAMMGLDNVVRSVKSWAKGKNIQCPNLKSL